MRNDLSPGLQAAQAVHAAVEFCVSDPETAARWHRESNFLVVVSVADEFALAALLRQAGDAGVQAHPVREPDIGDELTAIAFEPGAGARKLCAELPLALKEKKVMAAV